MNLIRTTVSGGMTAGLAVANLRVAVNKSLGFKADVFDVWADPRNEEIFLHVEVDGEKRKYPFPDNVMPLLKWGIGKYLKTTDDIHMIILRVSPGLAIAQIYFETEKGEKDCITKEFNV